MTQPKTVSRGGDEWHVLPWSVSDIRTINQQLFDRARVPHTKKLPFSACSSVWSHSAGEGLLVAVHHISHGFTPAARIGKLMKFSERCFAPYDAPKIKLATPAHYRRKASVEAGFGDQHDGTLTLDTTPLTRHHLAVGGMVIGPKHHLEITPTLVSLAEPWVYCTSIPPTTRLEATKLVAEFPEYEAVTRIADAGSFAMQLGIDFAISLDASRDVKLELWEELVWMQHRWPRLKSEQRAWDGRFDKMVQVYHGPVVYEDQSGTIESNDDFDKLFAHQECFTKRCRYSHEREYRFAVATSGKPQRDTPCLEISEELRELFSECTSPRRLLDSVFLSRYNSTM